MVSQADADKMVKAVSALGSIQLPTGGGLSAQELGRFLAIVMDRRERLSEYHSRVVIKTRVLEARVKNQEAILKIRFDDYYVNDETVKRKATGDGRRAMAGVLCLPQREVLNELRTELAFWTSALEVIEMAQENLKGAKESIRQMIHVIELEIDSGGGHRFGGR